MSNDLKEKEMEIYNANDFDITTLTKKQFEKLASDYFGTSNIMVVPYTKRFESEQYSPGGEGEYFDTGDTDQIIYAQKITMTSGVLNTGTNQEVYRLVMDCIGIENIKPNKAGGNYSYDPMKVPEPLIIEGVMCNKIKFTWSTYDGQGGGYVGLIGNAKNTVFIRGWRAYVYN